MPILLTTPLDPGSFDTATYDHVKIINQTHRMNRIEPSIMLFLSYGTVTDGVWVPGNNTPSTAVYPVNVSVSGEDYISLISHDSLDGEKTYAAVKRGLYEYLQSNYAALAGDIT